MPDPLIETQELHLGFGSFHFQLTKDAPSAFTGSEYLGWIKEALSQIAAAGDIEIDTYEPQYKEVEFHKPDEVEPYALAAYPFPPLDICDLRFTLHIPRRLQDDLDRKGLVLSPRLGEDFLVNIRDGWQLPVVMVWPLSPTDSCPASEAVIAVREFLREEFRRLHHPYVSFQCLGPSPVHFDAVVVPGNREQDQLLEAEMRPSHGYDEYVFRFRPPWTSSEEVADAFFTKILPEIEFLYRIQPARLEQSRAWEEALVETSRILDAYRASGVRGPVRRVFQGAGINRTLIALAEIELGQTQELQRIQNEFVSTYERGGDVLIRKVVEDDLSDFQPMPVQPISTLLELFDAGRRTARGVMIAAVSSLIGAAVAAIATLLAS